MDAKYDLLAERNLRLSWKFSLKESPIFTDLYNDFNAEIIWNDMYKLQIALFD